MLENDAGPFLSQHTPGGRHRCDRGKHCATLRSSSPCPPPHPRPALASLARHRASGDAFGSSGFNTLRTHVPSAKPHPSVRLQYRAALETDQPGAALGGVLRVLSCPESAGRLSRVPLPASPVQPLPDLGPSCPAERRLVSGRHSWERAWAAPLVRCLAPPLTLPAHPGTTQAAVSV